MVQRTSFDNTPSLVGEHRPEIQALRALAVMAVVVFHLWPQRLTGGYVGVDIFFVISGFLITAHMLREIDRTGSVKVWGFWARRLRRLLPASLTVLTAALLLTMFVVPAYYWTQNLDEIRSSALYFQNWQLAIDSVDYLAANNVPSLVQHFWSLSVEEQFYLVWPLIVLAAMWLASKRRGPRKYSRRAIGCALLLVTTASLTYCIYLTDADPALAYFATTTRAWEFGAGALLAVLSAHPLRGLVALRSVVSWFGLICIGLALASFNEQTVFPGALAIVPVVGTLAVIWAGNPASAWSPTSLASFGPIRFLGDVSYSLYLWHWPLIVAAPFVISRDLRGRDKLILLAISILLAWLTKVLIEDPARTATVFTRRTPQWTFAAAAGAMALVVGIVGVGGLTQAQRQQDSWALTEHILQSDSASCFGAASLQASPESCSGGDLDSVLLPDLAALKGDTGSAYGCFAALGAEMVHCTYGSKRGDALRVALVGDSHAAMLLPGIKEQLVSRNWSLETFVGAGCVWGNMGEQDRCGNRKSVDAAIKAGDFDAIVVTASRLAKADHSTWLVSGDPDPRAEDYARAWSSAAAGGAKIVVLADNPLITDRALECSRSTVPSDPSDACAMQIGTVYSWNDPMAEAASLTPGAVLISTQDLFCPHNGCPTSIGSARVYWDKQHITATYSRTIAPVLAERIDAAIHKAG